MSRTTTVTVLFATTVSEERLRFMELIALKRLDYVLLGPESLRDADRMLSSEPIDIIVTDLAFAGGAFADWLVLWPRPFILLSYYGEEARLDGLIRDEACSYVMRDAGFRHLGALPTMIRKVLNVRESLNRQNAHLQISERRYLDLVSSLPDIVYTLDGQGRFLYVNESVRQLGYRPTDLMGKHFSVLVDDGELPKVSRGIVLEALAGQATGPDKAPKLFDERRSGARMTRNLEVRLRAKPEPGGVAPVGRVDAYGEISCVGYPLPEYAGAEIGTVGIIRDVSLRRRETDRLRRNLQESNGQIKAIHRRIKDNLQVVSSLLSLQSAEISDRRSRGVFLNCQTQIRSIALVHEQLCHSSDLSRIDMRQFLTALVASLYRIHEIDPDRILVSVGGEAPDLDVDRAVPVGLIANELVVNAVRYAYPAAAGDGRSTEPSLVEVEFARIDPGRLRLSVADSGTGLPPNFDPDRSSGAGFRLVNALASQLSGTLQIGAGPGARVFVEFPVPPPAPKAPEAPEAPAF